MIAWALALGVMTFSGVAPPAEHTREEAMSLDGGPWSGRVVRRPFIVAIASGWPDVFAIQADQSWRWIALGAEIGTVLQWDPRWRHVVGGVRARAHLRVRIVHRDRGGLALMLGTGVREWAPPRPHTASLIWDHEVGLLGSIRVGHGDVPVHMNLGATVPLQYPARSRAAFWYAPLARIGVEIVVRPTLHVQVHGFVGPRLRRLEHFEATGIYRDMWWGLRVGVAFAFPGA